MPLDLNPDTARSAYENMALVIGLPLVIVSAALADAVGVHPLFGVVAGLLVAVTVITGHLLIHGHKYSEGLV